MKVRYCNRDGWNRVKHTRAWRRFREHLWRAAVACGLMLKTDAWDFGPPPGRRVGATVYEGGVMRVRVVHP